MKCKLREYLKAHNMTQRDLANMTGLTESAISRISAGDRSCTVRVAAIILNALQCSFNEIWEVA